MVNLLMRLNKCLSSDEVLMYQFLQILIKNFCNRQGTYILFVCLLFYVPLDNLIFLSYKDATLIGIGLLSLILCLTPTTVEQGMFFFFILPHLL